MRLAVTCHLHFWQNGRGRLLTAAVTRGWNGYRNQSQHRKLTLEKKILPPLRPGLEPATFRSRVRRSVPLSYPRSCFKQSWKLLQEYESLPAVQGLSEAGRNDWLYFASEFSKALCWTTLNQVFLWPRYCRRFMDMSRRLLIL